MLREALQNLSPDKRLMLQEAFDNIEPYVCVLEGGTSFLCVHSPTLPRNYEVTEVISYYSYGEIYANS